MQLPKWILGTLVIAVSLQSLPAQTTTLSSSTDSTKTDKFNQARAALFDFSRISDLTRSQNNSAVPKLGSHPPNSIVVLDPKHTRILADGDLCFTLRVYHFSQEDGEAPRMTGSTTCTAADRAGRKDAEEPNKSEPKRRFVPRLYKPL